MTLRHEAQPAAFSQERAHAGIFKAVTAGMWGVLPCACGPVFCNCPSRAQGPIAEIADHVSSGTDD